MARGDSEKPVRMKKRANGEGSVYQRKRDGRWIAEVIIGIDDDGKRQKKSFILDTEREARLYLSRLVVAKDDGILRIASKETLEEYLEYWLEHVVRPSKRPTTYLGYEQAVRCHILPGLGRIKLADLKAQHIQQVWSQKITENVGRSAIKAAHVVLRIALNHAVAMEKLQQNPIKGVITPTVETEEAQALTVEQVQRFYQVLRGERLEALYLMTLGCGLRIGETLGLRWKNVDWEQSIIHIVQTYIKIGSRMGHSGPKTRKSRRRIVMPGYVTEALRRWQYIQLSEQAKRGVDINKDWNEEFVFTTPKGTPHNPSNLRTRSLPFYLKQAGCPIISPHDLRHTGLSLFNEAGVDLPTIQKISGHSRISTLGDIYTHVHLPQQKKAAKQVDDLLAAKGKHRQ